MADVFTYPTSVELQEIEQDLMPRLIQDRPIFEFFPQKTQDAVNLQWEQKDNYVGLQQLRGINGAPHHVKPVGLKSYLLEPGIYGEFLAVDEKEMTERRKTGTFGTPINIDDLVRERQEQLLLRELDRIETIGWNLLINGTFSVSLPLGGIAHTDTFPIQTFASAVSWATAATSTPLNDFRNAALRARGHSVTFGAASKAYMNQQTLNYMLMNTNAADLYGRRTAGLGTFNNVGQIRDLLAGDNLPTIEVYDQGYLDENGVFRLFIPDGYVVVVGKRPAGQVVGEYRFVRNANNPDMGPGPYTRVIDNLDRVIPRKIEVHRGHNGGPVLFYPSSVLVLAV